MEATIVEQKRIIEDQQKMLDGFKELSSTITGKNGSLLKGEITDIISQINFHLEDNEDLGDTVQTIKLQSEVQIQ